jgi:2-polyprenyl-3-methyl-5-hydroxy-6-metoxy-1,4-benzoquinol methylase
LENICPICGSQKLKEFSIGKIFMYECMDCGIVFNKDIPDGTAIKEYYQKDYNLTEDIEKGIEKRRFFRYPEQLELLSIISKYKGAPAKILDIGCDRGFFLDEVRRYGYDIYGVEPLNKARQYLGKIGITAIDNIDKINAKFDIITMWHSLEHYQNPKHGISEIRQYLNDDGYLFIRVPAFDCLWRKVFKSKWIWFQPENHYFHYSLKSLKYLLNNSGFKTIEIYHRKPNNSLTKRSYKLSEKAFGKYFRESRSLRKKISRIYQDMTGVEIFAVSKMQ